MSIYFIQDFNGLTLGPGVPPGFSGSGSTVVLDPFKPGQCLLFTATGSITGTFTLTNAVSIFCMVNIHSGPTTFLQLYTNTVTPVCSFTFNLDNTLSCVAQGAGIYAWGPYPLPIDEWAFFQINISFGSLHVGGNTFTTITECDVAINGYQIVFAAACTTSVANQPIGIDTYNFQAAGLGGSYLDNIAAMTPVAMPYWPFAPVGTMRGRVSQIVLEPAEVPLTSEARISQMVLEPGLVPSSAKARISQMVIELMTNNIGVPVGVGNRVYES